MPLYNPTAVSAVTSAMITDGTIVDADINAAAAIKHSKLATKPLQESFLPTSAIAETFPRMYQANTSRTLTSGRLELTGCLRLRAGVAINTISVSSADVALVSGTNQWFCLVDTSLNVLKKTADDTSTAWAAHTIKTLTLSSAYTPVSDIDVYLGIVVVAATPPTIASNVFKAGPQSVLPFVAATSTTGLTNPASLGATAAALTGTDKVFYGYVS